MLAKLKSNERMKVKLSVQIWGGARLRELAHVARERARTRDHATALASVAQCCPLHILFPVGHSAAAQSRLLAWLRGG